MTDVLIFVALLFAFWAAGYLLVSFVCRLAARLHRDDLMAVAHAARPRCTHIGRASEPDHPWHECDLSPAHDAGPSPLHHCACGAYWRRAPHETLQIQELDALYAEPDGRH